MSKRKANEVTTEEFFKICLDAELIREESWDGKKYTKNHFDCAEEVCIKNNLSNNFIGPISGLTFSLWNDVQYWAGDFGIKHKILDNLEEKDVGV